MWLSTAKLMYWLLTSVVFIIIGGMGIFYAAYLGGMTVWMAFWMFNKTSIPEAKDLEDKLIRWYYPMLINAILLYTIMYIGGHGTTLTPGG